MRQANAFKIRLIKLLEILRQHSDEDNYLSTTEIIERLAAIGIVCDRRTLYMNTFCLILRCKKEKVRANSIRRSVLLI